VTAALRPLASIEDGDPRFGGKASGLARLLRAGAAVPDGFALSATTESPSRWPPELRDRFVAECDALLGRGRLAVRSSALLEDRRERSFAGLFSTVLDVDSIAAALAAAERCIASGASERVLAYAASDLPLAVGLVVQLMAPARAAGTLFTRDPQGVDGGILIEAAAGLGEALVAGHADPERWRIYRSALGEWESRREHRAAGVIGGILTVEEAALLAAEASRLANVLGEPLDLEWALQASDAAVCGGATAVAGPHQSSIAWLQARPITAAVDPPRFVIERSVPDADDGPITVWSNWNVRETMPEPLHPLTWALWRETILPFLTERFFGVPRRSPIFRQVASLDRIQGRVYFNLNAALAIPILGPLLRSMLHHVDFRAGAVMDDLLARGVLTPRRLRGAGRAPALASVASLLRSAPGTLRALRPEAALADLEAAAQRVTQRPAVESLEVPALLAELRLWESTDAGALRDGMQMLTVTLVTWIAADRLFAPWPDARRLLVAGIRGNPTTEISVRIDELIETARGPNRWAEPLAAGLPAARLFDALAASAEGRAWLERFRGFLEFCGQRGPREFDLAVPRWSDDPTLVLDLVRLGLTEREREPVGARLRRLATERDAAVAAAVRSAPAWKRPLLRRAASIVARILPLREAPKHYGLHVFQRMRHAALELGRRFAAADVLEAAEDVFFLELDELEALASTLEHRPCTGSVGRDGVTAIDGLAARIESRRLLLAELQARPAPDFLRSDGVPVDDGASSGPAADGLLHGTGVSRGVGTGVARVLDRPDPHAFAVGDVLVVQFADPGWTPLFPRAAALVMEVGGVMCHAAVVARELGIPAVFGVTRATELLASGQRVSVDGSRGVVKVL
jgi:rifampicin phosphotransferase